MALPFSLEVEYDVREAKSHTKDCEGDLELVPGSLVVVAPQLVFLACIDRILDESGQAISSPSIYH